VRRRNSLLLELVLVREVESGGLTRLIIKYDYAMGSGALGIAHKDATSLDLTSMA